MALIKSGSIGNKPNRATLMVLLGVLLNEITFLCCGMTTEWFTNLSVNKGLLLEHLEKKMCSLNILTSGRDANQKHSDSLI